MRDGQTHQPRPAKPQDAWVNLGRRRRRLAHQVYERDTHCYFCNEWVDQTLPPTHPKSRTAHHIIELQDGGPLDEIELMALAHRDCNTRAGVERAQQRLANQPIHIDPASL